MPHDPELPYLKKPGPSVDITRNPSESSHHASPDRTAMLQRLGVQEGGFFATWHNRYKRPSYQAQGPDFGPETTDVNLKGPDLKPIGQAAITEVKAGKLNTQPTFQAMQGQQQRAGSYTGQTRNQLRNLEMTLTANQLRAHIADNPFLSTSVLDTMTATSINMDRQVLMDMAGSPTKMLTQATMDYYLSHGSTIQGESQTNFEKAVSAYSETKKIASKNINYAAAEMGKTVAKLKKNPIYPGAANMINIGSSGGYNPTYYSSPLG